MALGYLTSSSLISTVKREAMIPTSQSTFTDADFLSIANQEMRIGLVPSIMLYHQEYYVRDAAPITLVANQSAYPIPYRAVGGKFRELFYADTNGNLMKMTRISPDNRPYFQSTSTADSYLFFYIEGNDVVLAPSVGPSPTGSLVFSFWMRPNELVSETRVGTITNIAADATLGTTTFTLSSIPANFASNVKYDVMQTNPGHKTIAFDAIPLTMDATNLTITFTTTDVQSATLGTSVGTGAIVGDYLALAGECIIPQAPSDLHDVLSQRVVMRCLQALGDQAGYAIAQSKLKEMESALATLTDNRSEGQAVKANNVLSPLRSSKLTRRGFWS